MKIVPVFLAALLVVAGLAFGTPSQVSAQTATCKGSVGPGIPPPAQIPAGIPGFHAVWYGQSGYPTLCPGERATSVVAYYNSGSLGWVQGRMGEAAYLGTWNWIPGQDKPSKLGGDGTNGSPATGWPRYNRIATQPAPYVGPGQVAWFTFTIQAPAIPGVYKLYLRPLVEGATWMEDYGVFWVVTVLNPDGTQPPPPPPDPMVGCSPWPEELGNMLSKLSMPSKLCFKVEFEPPAFQCITWGACYESVRRVVWLSQAMWDSDRRMIVTFHETCHAHQHRVHLDAGSRIGGWPVLPEGVAFGESWSKFKSTYPAAYSQWGDAGSDFENFAEVCAAWYYPTGRVLRVIDYPPLLQFAQEWLPK